MTILHMLEMARELTEHLRNITAEEVDEEELEVYGVLYNALHGTLYPEPELDKIELEDFIEDKDDAYSDAINAHF